MNPWLAVFVGGGIGSLLRFALSRLVVQLMPRAVFPWATLASNLLSSLILAWVVWRLYPRADAADPWRLFLVVGVCGGFSTFSTFSYENFLLLRDGQTAWAMANIALNLLGCLLVFQLFARTT